MERIGAPDGAPARAEPQPRPRRRAVLQRLLPRRHAEEEEPEEWFAFPAAFAARDRVLLVGGPGSIAAYAVADGRSLGAITVEGDGCGGFAIDEARWVAWVPGSQPTSYALPEAWRSARAATTAAKSARRAAVKKAAKKTTTAKKTTAKKTAAKK